jgi:hypothetical protein
MPLLGPIYREPIHFELANCRLVVLARTALAEDEMLQQLNLGVTVKGRIALLWGAVPSAQHDKRACEVVGKVPGIIEVRDELRIELPESDPTLSRRWIEEKSGQPQNTEGLKSNSKPENWKSPTRLETSLTSQSGDSGPAAVLLAPIPVPKATVGNSICATTVSGPNGRYARLRKEVEQIRQADARFQQLRAEVANGSIQISGIAIQPQDAFDLAQNVSRLPGVASVKIENVFQPSGHVIAPPSR